MINFEACVEKPIGAYQRFLEQMKLIGLIATSLGRRFPNESCDKFIATTEFIDPANFYACTTIIYKYPMNGGLQLAIGLDHFLPAHPGHTSRPYEKYASISLSNRGLIDLRAKPCFVPEAEHFEEPTPDPKFPHPRTITKEFFLFDHWLVRGPITSLGPRTREFLYGFLDQAVNDLLAA